LATGKEKIVVRYQSYHGSTYGAMALANDCRNWACGYFLVRNLFPFQGLNGSCSGIYASRKLS
jgi:4-aminobutyrate aminotransferase-like enzyme